MATLTGKQCRQARSLLKWNLQDLAGHVKNILARRIDSFEHGIVHLLPWEHDELRDAFKKAGVVFKADLEVALLKDTGETKPQQAVAAGGGAGMHIVISAEEALTSGDAKENAALKETALSDEEKRREGKKRPL